MSNIANIEGVLPGFSGEVSVVSYSGCCAIFSDGTLIGNGALLWSGKHVVTAAHILEGISWSSLSFQFNTALSYVVPPVAAVITHPGYVKALDISNYDIALIEFADYLTPSLSRYIPEVFRDAVQREFYRSVFGPILDPNTGYIKGALPYYWIDEAASEALQVPVPVINRSNWLFHTVDRYTASGEDFSVVTQFASAGSKNWQKRFGAGVHLLAADSFAGMFVVAGHLLDQGAKRGFVCSLTNTGAVLWAKIITASFDLSFTAISIDGLGNSVLSGVVYTPSRTLITCKLLPTGAIDWAKRFTLSGSGDFVYLSSSYGTSFITWLAYISVPHPSDATRLSTLLIRRSGNGGISSPTVWHVGAGFNVELQSAAPGRDTPYYYAALGSITSTATGISSAFVTLTNSYFSVQFTQQLSNTDPSQSCKALDVCINATHIFCVCEYTLQGQPSKYLLTKLDFTGVVVWQSFISGLACTGIKIRVDESSIYLTARQSTLGFKPITVVISAGTGLIAGGSLLTSTTADATIAPLTLQSAAYTAPTDVSATVTLTSPQIAVDQYAGISTLVVVQQGSSGLPSQFYTVKGRAETSSPYLYAQGIVSSTFDYSIYFVYDYGDGTTARDTIYGIYGTNFSRQALGSFVSPYTYGAASFTGAGLLRSIHTAIYAYSPPTKAASSLPGCYGSVAVDLDIASQLSFLTSNLGLAPHYTAPSNYAFLAYARVDGAGGSTLKVLDEPNIFCAAISGTYSSSIVVSENYGLSWSVRPMPFTVGGGRYAYLYSIAKYGSRWIAAGNRAIWTSDDGINWTMRLDILPTNPAGCTSSLFRHPITGVWVQGGFRGHLYTSTDNGITWTDTQLYDWYAIEIIYIASSATFVAFNYYGLHTSVDGINWVRRRSGIDHLRSSGDILYSTLSSTISIDGGCTWLDPGFPKDSNNYYPAIYYGDGVYLSALAESTTNTSVPILHRSLNKTQWSRSPGSANSFDLDRSGVKSMAFGNGLIAAITRGYCQLHISEDYGLTWKKYQSVDDAIQNNDIIAFLPDREIWVHYGYDGFFYTKDPRTEWIAYPLIDYYGDIERNVRQVVENSAYVLVVGGYDIYRIEALNPQAEITYNYATKVQPISGSGLVGVVAGSTHFSGTLLQTGKDILTSAHAVVGITDYASVQIIFNVDAAITIPAPTVIGITSHPSYNVTPGTSGWINYDLAIIHLQDPVDARVSRYELYSGDEAMPVVFNKTGYGHAWDPVIGVAEVDNLHFITFQNRYESLGLPLQGLGVPYIASDLHLLYDYDDGTSTHDAIGESSGFINQPSNTGLGANEGFTAPGRSGSAGLLGGKIAGVTFGTYSIPGGFDINGTSSDATYGEVGIDMRISMFSSWIADIADFGVDVEGSLPGFSSDSELWFTQPTGLVVEGSLSGLTASLVAAQPDQFGIDQLLPGLSPDIIVTIPWQMEATVSGLTSDISLEKAPAIAVDGELLAFTSSFDITAVGAFDWEARLPALVPDQQLELAALFAAQSTLSLSGGIVLQPAYDVSLSGILPVLASDFLVKSDFEVVALLPSLISELDLIYRSIEFTARLPELTGDMSLEGYTFNVDSKLLALQGDFQWAHNEMAIDATMPALLGGMKFHATSDVVFEATLPDLTFEGLWQGMELADVMPGLRGGMKVIDANSCTTRYL